MGDGLVALIILIAFIAVTYFAMRSSTPIDHHEHGLPAELRGAELAYAEVTFRSHRHRLVARLDRAYRTPAGIQLVELKTRQRDVVHMSDVIELSVQRIALQDQTGEVVSEDAWVVVQNSRTSKRRSRKIRLMGLEDITVLRERYVDVVQGRAGRLAPAPSPSQCGECAHRARCGARFQDRG